MENIIEKISSYNIINYMLPGAIFSAFIKRWLGYDFFLGNLLFDLFTIYFIGLVISRLGSLIIEPLLKKIKFINFASYKDFVKQEKIDIKIGILNEHNNLFRTLCATMFLLIILKIYKKISIMLCFSQYNTVILIVSLFIMFLFSYRKQTLYIKNRVEANSDDKKSE